MREMIVALVLLSVLGSTCFAEIPLPAEVSNVKLGMSKADLLAARPGIKLLGLMGEPLDATKPDLILFEGLKSTSSIYSSVTYAVEGDRLISFGLTGYPKKGAERTTRRKAIRDARALYGAANKKRVPEDAIRKGKGIAAFIWEKEKHEILLLLPVRRENKDTMVSPVSLQIRPVTPKNKPLADMALSQAEKDAVLKENDGDDMGAPK